MPSEWVRVDVEDDDRDDPWHGRKPKKPKFVADEDVPDWFVGKLQHSGINIVPASAITKRGTSDHDLLHAARKTGRILVTLDKDFKSEVNHPTQLSPGIIVLTPSAQTAERLVSAMAQVWYRLAKYLPGDWWQGVKVIASSEDFVVRIRTKGTVEEFCIRSDGLYHRVHREASK